ncbi:TFIIB-type zinc ribbon-containing protein [Mesoterricola silvestris]|uniref:Transcription factor zinc-finger domain-containing protein n=1 Tax=Mesoterricola silvestris TaxID=2927979 RepID=A0AA48K8Q7_9BACT|nr:zf-TFIIB domain-containing protein [Mesoterricola silvestris]BDU72591.1 hypothetical protein METEAL_17650 [Mesoterricola silvestris]
MEAATLNCRSCGAAVGENDVRCPYCRSQLATVACPRCLGMVSVHAAHCSRCGAEITRAEAAPTELACPACRAKLLHTSVGDAHLDSCHACGGVWVAQAEFERIAGGREERGGVLGALPGEGPGGPIHAEEIRYRPCALCGKFMNRVNYARTSGVILDVCKDHGLWFDPDELRRVLAFIEAGGLDKNREREIRELDEKRRNATPEATSGLPMSDPFQISGPGSTGLELVVRGLFGLSRWL